LIIILKIIIVDIIWFKIIIFNFWNKHSEIRIKLDKFLVKIRKNIRPEISIEIKRVVIGIEGEYKLDSLLLNDFIVMEEKRCNFL
jgi:hypothetical protein